MIRRFFIVLCVLTAGARAHEAALGAPISPRPATIKPEHSTVTPFHRNDAISVKFRDDLMVRADGGGLTDRNSGALHSTARGVLTRLAGGHWSCPYEQSEAKLAELRHNAKANLGKEVADLRTQFVFSLPPGADLVKVIDDLNALDIVEIALPLPRPVAAPTPPNLQAFQGYLNASTVGIDAIGMWNTYATTGSSVRIADIEYSWNFNHQDLAQPILVGPPPVDPYNSTDHGTAVLGELSSINNGWGTIGACYATGSIYVAAANTAAGWDVGAAIMRALAVLQPGDVLLIEQQMIGPNYTGNPPDPQFGLVPVEWYQPWYNAIATAVGNNITVVEAACNGSQNLDDPIYSTGNGGHWPFLLQNDSGALIVGAGGPPGYPSGDRARMSFSNYGATVDLQGWGAGVTTTGYGDAYSAEGPNLYYTRTFGGTSSASPNVAAAACLLQDYVKWHYGLNSSYFLTPAHIKSYLVNAGSAQLNGTYPASQHIGPRPNVTAAAAQLDFTPPSPDPSGFQLPPQPIGLDQIQMIATPSSDSQSPPVQYRFQDLVSGHPELDSGWSSSNSQVFGGLTANTQYGFRVQARDSFIFPNETGPSIDFMTATFIETPAGLSFGTVTESSIQVNVAGSFTNLTLGQSGLYYEMTPAAPGSAANSWVQTTSLNIAGLSPGTTYTFRVKARNQFGIETAFTPSASQATSGSASSGSCDCNGDGILEVDLDTACFTAVLLGTNLDAGSIARSDFNGDGHVDGRDISAFMQCILGGGGGNCSGNTPMNPTPPDQAIGVQPDSTYGVFLSWMPGAGSNSSDVYWGTDWTAVSNATTFSPEYKGNTVSNSFTARPLTNGTTYFWRVDARTNSSVCKGSVWQFTTAGPTVGMATNPNPPNFASGVFLNSMLMWNSGSGAASHNVYFGTDWFGVNNATTFSPEFRGNQSWTSYTPGTLAPNTTYYWRIDEVASDFVTMSRGEIWQFTTAP